MDVLLTLIGVVLIVVGLQDVFHALLHPRSQGTLTDLVLTGAWRLSRATGHALGGIIGPAAMVAVILMWVLFQVTGWALVSLPHVPEGFSYSPGVDPADYARPAEAVYVSLVGLATLGLDDVVPTQPIIRLAFPLEALTGFALLTAALTWFTQIYPPLSRRRALATGLYGLASARWHEGLDARNPAAVSRVLDDVTEQVLHVGVDFTQHSETYNFRESDPSLALAAQLPYALVLRDAARRAASPDVRMSGERLAGALERLREALVSGFTVDGDSVEEAVASYAADHGRAPRPA
ncbi:two pore domain potassium channel family protein [Micrococcus flavus]|uniref:Potassium channel domain-containing protein n=1 Tax=Micrococcus flavus TaxID=384602 RepID=A0A4Y8WZG6_9MICC|nr:ion channel [Micrococcus flavus]MBB4883874.1 hypothetical protein [Micrococcus flavus]TFI00107.1 two pore domain potassium channel family protein [Micrococcus flavus]GGK51941.1 hypothetical protein GCM10007073_18890 [Micrococcus flavus]